MSARPDRTARSWALVTGASSGIGREICRELASMNHDIVMVARRGERLLELETELRSQHRIEVERVLIDLTEPGAPEHIFQYTCERGIQVDLLVNCAGVAAFGAFVELDWLRTARLLQVDVVALTELTHRYGRQMAERGSGRILLVSSLAGFQPSPFYAAYSAAKSYVLTLGQALAHELSPKGVTVSVLAPGVTATEALQVAGQEPTQLQRASTMSPRQVAQLALLRLRSGCRVIVPGFANRLSLLVTSLLPTRWRTAIAYRIVRDAL